ncbi:hypothetical protein HELRODRAFT_176475 [Helobdella robusta]|uniref:Uncharacterized protein n=1 Tax=Helobdella robusta TaxID=6412 RepID=T1FAJ7_HELRO|nr:hypothetical protein HELRODRAFT_176475 [Helobdella robusta]ESN99715.1 hypothetical protein HELRODRAFT_176475 [Helobdella robusta]
MPVSKVQLPKNYQPEILELLKSNNFINNSKKVHDVNADFKFDSNGKHISISSKDDDTLYNAVRNIQRQIDSIKISNISPTCISQTLLQRIVQSDVFHGWFKNFMRDNEVNDVMLIDKKNNEIAVIAIMDAKIKLFTSWLKKVVVKEHITFLHLHNETALEELGKFFSHLQSIYYIVVHVAKNSLKIEGFVPDVYPAKGSSCVLLEGNQVCVCSNSNQANPAILRMSLPTCNVLVEKCTFISYI